MNHAEAQARMEPYEALFLGHYETPASNPDVGTKHDDPEEVDQKEFNDQDHSPKNIKNPETGEPGGVTTGEDNAVSHDTPFKHDGEGDKSKDGEGGHDEFAEGSPAIERLQMLMPLLLQFLDSGQSGANDPHIKELHNMLEQEMPGYLDKGEDGHAEILIQQLHPKHAVVENGGQTGTAPEMIPRQEMSDVQPLSQEAPGGMFQTGHCSKCGTPTQGGQCPACGNPAGQPHPQQAAPQPQMFSSLIETLVAESNHVGPTTPEQIAIVQAWLLEHGRDYEVPNVPLDPNNPEYVKILAETQNKANVPPVVSPEEVTPPPPPPAPPGQEGPPEGPQQGPPGTGGSAQALASWVDDSSLFNFVLAADNVAEACPQCGSHTTGMDDAEGNQSCSACKHKWKRSVNSDADVPFTSSIRTAQPMVNQPSGEEAAPGDQRSPLQIPQQQPSHGLTWETQEGEPLEAGKTYIMESEEYPIPDMIKVMRVKPDGLEVNIMGGLGERPDALTTTEHITREEMIADGLSFKPLPMSADERQQQPPPGGGAPGEAPAQPTTDEYENSYPEHQSSVTACTKCGHEDGDLLTNGNMISHTSSMISEDQSEHECSFCGNTWITKEAAADLYGPGLVRDGEDWKNPSAEWLNEDDSWSDTDRMRMMQTSKTGGSRNIQDIELDKHAREVKEHLDNQPKFAKEAGRYFSPLEQRGLIDERGHARNSDLLDLEGTHYKTSTEEGKLDPERVPLEHIIMGL